MYAGFEPYEQDMSAQWGNLTVTHSVANSDEQLWAEVVWELSVLNFRLEFAGLDRQLAADFYLRDDQSIAAHREASVFRIWDTCGIRPLWQVEALGSDPLGSESWVTRQSSVKLMAMIMQAWPHGRTLAWDDFYTVSKDAYLAYEHNVFKFYATTFRSCRGRLPTVPFIQPPSLASRLG